MKKAQSSIITILIILIIIIIAIIFIYFKWGLTGYASLSPAQEECNPVNLQISLPTSDITSELVSEDVLYIYNLNEKVYSKVNITLNEFSRYTLKNNYLLITLGSNEKHFFLNSTPIVDYSIELDTSLENEGKFNILALGTCLIENKSIPYKKHLLSYQILLPSEELVLLSAKTSNNLTEEAINIAREVFNQSYVANKIAEKSLNESMLANEIARDALNQSIISNDTSKKSKNISYWALGISILVFIIEAIRFFFEKRIKGQ